MYKATYTLVDLEDGNPDTFEQKLIKTDNPFAALIALRQELKHMGEFDVKELRALKPETLPTFEVLMEDTEEYYSWGAENIILEKIPDTNQKKNVLPVTHPDATLETLEELIKAPDLSL